MTHSPEAPPAQHATHNHAFSRLASWASTAAGRPAAFGIAAAIIVLWAFLGPVFGYSNTWQLVVNTATTIITFLMVFLIQHTQNRDTTEIHIKLDELIRVSARARNVFITLEELEEDELERLRVELRNMAHRKPVGIPTPDQAAPASRPHHRTAPPPRGEANTGDETPGSLPGSEREREGDRGERK